MSPADPTADVAARPTGPAAVAEAFAAAWNAADADALAAIETRDNGKPLAQARADMVLTARYFEYYGGAADKVHGEVIPFQPGTTVAVTPDRRFLRFGATTSIRSGERGVSGIGRLGRGEKEDREADH